MTTEHSFRSASTVIAAVVLAGLPVSKAYSAAIAGQLLIDLDAANYNPNTAIWRQTGTTGIVGDFIGSGSVTKTTVNGVSGVNLDGGFEHLMGPRTSGTTIEATTPTYSVEVWAYQGNVRDEETLVGWAHRGADNSNVGFNWGVDQAWGAAAHWGGSDLGWTPGFDATATSIRANGNTTTNVPQPGSWRLLTYTYDGTTERVYSDGVLRNSEAKTLTPFKDNEIVIGTQNEGQNIVHGGRADLGGSNGINNNGNDLTFSGVIGKVRIHSLPLTEQQIAENYALERGTFQLANGGPASQLTRGPVNRYSFTGTSGAIAPGTQVLDSIGAAHGNVRGSGAVTSSDGKSVVLPGGSSATAAYIDLPNGLMSSRENITLEAWVTQTGDQNWSRIMDFGTGDAGEIFDAGGTSNGVNYVMISANVGTSPNQRVEHIGGFSPNPNGGTSRDSQFSRILNTEVHLALTYELTTSEWKWYQDGALMETIPDLSGLGSVPDVNNWLGRSQWTGDANFQGSFNEFRIYDYALSQAELAGNFRAGPDAVNIVPEPASMALLSLGASLLCLRRRRS